MGGVKNIYKQKLIKIFDIQKGRGFYEETKKTGILLMLVCWVITLALPVTTNAAVKMNKTK